MTKQFGSVSAFCVVSACVAAVLWGSPAQAQLSTQPVAQNSGELDEIIVTARKRDETLFDVPVVETAIAQVQLERMQTVDITDLPNVVTGLQFGRGELSIGTEVSIRGVGTTTNDQGVDSSVALAIDGLTPGSGLAFESGLFDLGQIEVLKGPQALFFGKSSPGGVISIRTADPTDQFEVIARTAYEFESLTNREEAIISGPVTDTLKLRLASMYSSGQGYFYNTGVAVPGTGAVTPTDSRGPGSTEYNIRGTALWSPWSQFDARLKLNLVHDRSINQEADQLTSCPEGSTFSPVGISFIGSTDNCQLSRNNRVVWMNPGDFPGIINNGVPFVDSKQEFAILELNYRPSEALTLTSVTADYQLISSSLTNALETTGAGTPLAAENYFHRRELTEEIRLNSNFSGPLNFTVGGFYEDGLMKVEVLTPGNTALPNPFVPIAGFPNFAAYPSDVVPVEIKTDSLFGQARWALMPKLELAAGVRWSNETRTESPINACTLPGSPPICLAQPDGSPIAVLQPRVHADNLSPEVTLTFKPTDELMTYAAWKEGFKSGSFSLSTALSPGQDNAFGQETARGAEIGVKTRLLDHRLTANLAGYLYNYSGLQVGTNEPTQNGAFVDRTVNAGAARVYGIDFDTAYRPIEELGVNAALNWNHARYLTLNNVPCWAGQTIALGCNQAFSPGTGLYTSQNLSGTPLIRAPSSQAQLGVNYEYALAHDYKLTFSNNNAFSSRYVTYLAIGRPNNDNYQGSFIKSDVSVSLQGPGDTWELALIGKDLSDKLTVGNCAAAGSSSAAIYGTQIQGGTSSGPDGLGSTECFVDPGREVWLRLTVRPFASKE